MYTFLFKYDDKNELYQLPIPPSFMTTNLKTNTKIFNTIGQGEITTFENMPLRDIKLKFILPNDINLPFVLPKYSPNSFLEKPIFYLNLFRKFKQDKKPFRFMITRILPDGKEIFKTNIRVSLENYTVFEVAGEEGDFYVELNLKEFREPNFKKISINSDGNYNIIKNREHKEFPKTYIVKKGDTLWDIAKRELNDEKLYKNLMHINNITEPRKLQIGTVLKLS